MNETDSLAHPMTKPDKSKPKQKKELVISPTFADLMEFRKTNEAIGLRIKEGKLSLLSRKLFNVLVYHAQQLKEPGRNAPIDTEAAKKYFWIPLSEVARDAAYDSNDIALIKQHLEEFQNIKVHIEDDRQWTSERLISSVKLVNPLGLRKKGGIVWLGFAFPPEVFELVMNPAIYTKLSIQYQGLLRSGASLALYEICRRYATNPSKVTAIHSYPYWYSALTGNPVRDAVSPYKYFKRDVIKPSILEINAATDIDVELIEYKTGRCIDRLQFAVELKRQERLDFPTPIVINAELIRKVATYGFSSTEASDLLAIHGEDKILACLHAVEARMAARNSPPLDSPVAYFRWCLRHGASVTQKATGKPRDVSPNRKRMTLMDKFLAHRSRQALVRFNTLSNDEQAELLERLKQSPDGRFLKIGRGTTSPMVRSIIGYWYANELWGEPSAEALSDFAETGRGEKE